MSWQIQIIQAKPNPSGKDRSRYGANPTQLLGEWVDLKNLGDTDVHVSCLHLAHREFDGQCRPTSTSPSIYWTGGGSDVLRPGQTVRVHTGNLSNFGQMTQADKLGMDFHSYADRSSFVLNNKCGDDLSVWWKTNDDKWQKEDSASYDPLPPEGAVLVRSGQKLIVTQVTGIRTQNYAR